MTVLLKYIHVACVAASYILFFLRGVWLMRDSPIMRQRWMKIIPHAVDTLLLASAVLLAWQMDISPFKAPWLLAKIIALLAYVGLGFVAIRLAKTPHTRLIAWLAAQAVFFYIVAVAVTKEVLPWQAL